jgi:orotidine-5'-phosphate decarboxylase
MNRNFFKLLKARHEKGLRVCVGLDLVIDKIPHHLRERNADYDAIAQFGMEIIDATHELACAYKPNAAFFEAIPTVGSAVLQSLISHINKVAPDVPVIFDGKRGDIGNTNDGYIKSAFDIYGSDAITVHPYMGRESLQPILDQKDKGVFVLCRTSNPGAGEFQDLSVYTRSGSITRMYAYVAEQVSTTWNSSENCALVVGATAPIELVEVRDIVGPKMTILIPGIGAQGGDIEKTVKAGGPNIIVNLSRSVLFASSGEDFAKAAWQEVERVNTEIHKWL